MRFRELIDTVDPSSFDAVVMIRNADTSLMYEVKSVEVEPHSEEATVPATVWVVVSEY